MKSKYNPFKFQTLATTATLCALAATSASAQTLLLSDNFDSVGVGNTGFNDGVALDADQDGTQAPLSYTLSSTGWDGYIQRGNGGQMLLAGYDNPGTPFVGQVFASLNKNFADDANTLNSPLEIKFNINVTDSNPATVPTGDDWGTVAVGSGQNAFVNDPANKFSSLFRDNGGTQQFSNAVQIGSTATFADGNLVTLVISNAAETGSAFNSDGATDVVKLYINGSLVETFTGLELTASDGYISFQATSTKAYYDNLAITATAATVADPFADWMSTNYPAIVAPDNAPTADPDNDGIDNLVEYVLQNGDPSVSTTGILPTLDASGANFVFTYYRRAAATGTTQTFEYGTTLSGWTPVAIPGGSGVTVYDQGGGIDKVEIIVAKGAETKLFGRLQVMK